MANNLFRHLLGLGLKAFAQDAKPEELAEAAEAVKEHADDKKADDKKADDKRADDRKADDKKCEDVAYQGKNGSFDGDRAKFHKMLDQMLDMEEFGGKKEEEPKPVPPVPPAVPAKAAPAPVAPEEARDLADRKRLHSALDRFLKMHSDDRRANDRPVKDTRADDVDIRELRDLLDEYLEEEAQEPEHEEGAREGGEAEGAEEEAADFVSPEEREKEEEERFAMDAGEPAGPPEKNLKSGQEPFEGKTGDSDIIEPIREGSKSSRVDSRDEAEAAFLRRIRPIVARSNDRQAISEFNARLRRLTGQTKVSKSGAGYGEFARAASARDNKSQPQTAVSEAQRMEALYASMHGKIDPRGAVEEYLKSNR